MIRAAGTDRFGNPVVAERLLTISGKKDETKLRILADRQRSRSARRPRSTCTAAAAAGTALLTWEADRILSYKIVPPQGGRQPVAWDVDGPQFPNFTLAASRMAPSAFDEARLDVRVERDLRVTLSRPRPRVGPGERGRGRGRRPSTRLASPSRPSCRSRWSIARCSGSSATGCRRSDRSSTTSRGPAFADRSRRNTFRYQPATVPVPEAVVEDAAQQAAQLADAVRSRRGEKRARPRADRAPGASRRTAPAAPRRGPLGGMSGSRAEGASAACESGRGERQRATATEARRAASAARDRPARTQSLGSSTERAEPRTQDGDVRDSGSVNAIRRRAPIAGATAGR